MSARPDAGAWTNPLPRVVMLAPRVFRNVVKGVPVRVVVALVGLPPSQLISRRPLARVRDYCHCWRPRAPRETDPQYFEPMLRMGRLPGIRLALRIALQRNHWFVQRLVVQLPEQ